jgi:multiple sugar transport system substrate-binding protein
MRAVTRRSFIKGSAAAAATVALASPLSRTYGQGAKLDWWNPHGSPAFMAQWETLLAAFKKESGIDVTNVIVGWGDLVPRLTQAATSKTMPGVATGGSGFPQIFASQGVLTDVSATIAAIEGAGSKFLKKAVLASSYQGKPYGIPRYTATNGITFRKDLLEKAGVQLPDPAGGKYAFSWDEFVEVCQRLTKAPDQYALAAAGTTFDAEKVIWNFLVTNESYILDKDGKLAWESDRTVESYRFLADIFRRFAPPATATYDLAAANMAFTSGKVAMSYGDGDVHADVDSSHPDSVSRIGFMPSPIKTVKAGYGGTVTFMIPATDQRAAAGTFAQFMLRPENLAHAIWPFRILVTPATDAARKSDILTNDPTVRKWSAVLGQMAAVAENACGVAQYYAASPEAGSIESSGILSKTMQKILVNNVDPERAVAEAKPELEQIMRG